MLLLYMMFRWFGDVIRESEGGKYDGWEDLSFRWGMSWFIFSEVMFFAAFFGALFYVARAVGARSRAASTTTATLWPGFKAALALGRPGLRGEVLADGAPGASRRSTPLLLLSSGVTVTIAHWALKEGKRAHAQPGSCSSPSRWA